MKVFLNVPDADQHEKEDLEKLLFARVPVVGEFIAICNSSNRYKVVLVLHTPYLTKYDVEVWCVKITRKEATKNLEYKNYE